jgi:hypothetical protein
MNENIKQIEALFDLERKLDAEISYVNKEVIEIKAEVSKLN